MTAPEPLTPVAETVSAPRIHNIWDELTFLHWPVDPAAVQAQLPSGLRVDTFEDQGWVSLVPFVMRGVRPHRIPAAPWISTFAETNVRTYVVDDDGRRGVWFASLEAQRLAIVAGARWMKKFPYVWSRMTFTADGDRRIYETLRRRWPRSPATSRVVIDIGEPTGVPDSGLDLFLTARWFAHTHTAGRVRRARVDHPPWQLREATLVECEDELVAAGGFEPLTDAPRVGFAECLDAHFGATERLG